MRAVLNHGVYSAVRLSASKFEINFFSAFIVCFMCSGTLVFFLRYDFSINVCELPNGAADHFFSASNRYTMPLDLARAAVAANESSSIEAKPLIWK